MRCKLSNIKIQAITTYLPTNILEMSSLVDSFGEDNVKSVINATGVQRVRVADKKQTASDMCFESANYLIEQEGIDRSIIDGLVFVSQTHDYIAPATSVVLQGRLGLLQETVCFDISYGCSGYIYGIFQASLLVSTGACKNVLLLAGDTTTKMINDKDRPHKMVFGDCGSATLVTKGEDTLGFDIHSDGKEFETVIVPAGGFRNLSTEETRIEYTDSEGGNTRSKEDLHMDGNAVFNFIVHNGSKSIKDTLEFMEWDKDDVDFYALHQATKFTLNYLRKRFKLDAVKVPTNIQNYGNTGPTTIPLVITDVSCRDMGYDSTKWSKVIMSAYGVGLSWGTIACDLSKTNIYKPINQ